MTGPTIGNRWPVACRQWQGARPYQEDDFGTLEGSFTGHGEPPSVLLVLTDGMGGEAGGAKASRTVVQVFTSRFPELDGTACARFQTCLEEATGSLCEQTRDDPGLDGMGSTVVAAHHDGRELAWLSVGDSPMWLFTGGKLVRLNADHSMAPVLDRLVRDSELSPGEARVDSRRNMLRSAVTASKAKIVDCAARSCRVGPDEFLLIASDGIQTLAEEDIERHLAAANGDTEAAADALFSAVRDAAGPGQDNMTFLLLSGLDGHEERTGQPGRGLQGKALPWRGLGLGLAIGLLTAALVLWWLVEPSPPGAGREPAAASGATGPAGKAPEARRPEPARQEEAAPAEARTEEAGGPAPAPDSLRPHVPGSADLDTPEEPAPAARPGEPATAGEALSAPSEAAPEASR